MRYQFEDFILDADRRELTRGSEPVAVGPQVFDLLLHLVGNRAHVVTKDELLDAVWNGRIVSELTLTSHINAARKAIGDTGEAAAPGPHHRAQGLSVRGRGYQKGNRHADAIPPKSPQPSSRAVSRGPPCSLFPSGPSIAVLALSHTLARIQSRSTFTDGVVDDIISALLAHALAIREPRAEFKLHLQRPRG